MGYAGKNLNRRTHKKEQKAGEKKQIIIIKKNNSSRLKRILFLSLHIIFFRIFSTKRSIRIVLWNFPSEEKKSGIFFSFRTNTLEGNVESVTEILFFPTFTVVPFVRCKKKNSPIYFSSFFVPRYEGSHFESVRAKKNI